VLSRADAVANRQCDVSFTYGRIGGGVDWQRLVESAGNGIALIFARTETADFHAQVWEKAAAILFLRGRIHFHYPDGTQAKANAGAPSVLVAYGDRMAMRLRTTGLAGHYVLLRSEGCA
jgi:hypothetical protein